MHLVGRGRSYTSRTVGARDRALQRRLKRRWKPVLGSLEDDEVCLWDAKGRMVNPAEGKGGYLLVTDRRLFFSRARGLLVMNYPEIVMCRTTPGPEDSALLTLTTETTEYAIATGAETTEIIAGFVRRY